MRKTTIIAVATLALGLAACSKPAEEAPAAEATTEAAAPAATEAATAAATEAATDAAAAPEAAATGSTDQGNTDQ